MCAFFWVSCIHGLSGSLGGDCDLAWGWAFWPSICGRTGRIKTLGQLSRRGMFVCKHVSFVESGIVLVCFRVVLVLIAVWRVSLVCCFVVFVVFVEWWLGGGGVCGVVFG